MNLNKYKTEEKNHYDSKYQGDREYVYPKENELNNKDKVNIAARRYLENKTFEILKLKKTGEILDYGCAIGEKTYKFSSENWRITGIDISSKSVEVAKELARKYSVNAEYFEMDCENLTFNDNRFDIIFNYGTFSSLDMNKAIKELCRVLKPDGYLLAIETLGNNPVFKLKRSLNVISGSRTRWAASHIMKIEDWKRIGILFNNSDIKYYSLLTPYLSPFLSFIPKKMQFGIISFFERIDTYLLKFNFFKRFAFKTVAVLGDPIK
jgi:ubiquinone/menaquinone biosynthesis C-methylase UbiE